MILNIIYMTLAWCSVIPFLYIWNKHRNVSRCGIPNEAAELAMFSSVSAAVVWHLVVNESADESGAWTSCRSQRDADQTKKRAQTVSSASSPNSEPRAAKVHHVRHITKQLWVNKTASNTSDLWPVTRRCGRLMSRWKQKLLKSPGIRRGPWRAASFNSNRMFSWFQLADPNNTFVSRIQPHVIWYSTLWFGWCWARISSYLCKVL